MRLRLGSARDGSDSVLVYDGGSKTWVALVDVSPWPHGDGTRRSILALLALGRGARTEIAAAVAAAAPTRGVAAPAARLPFAAASLRDAALYPRHVRQATHGFKAVARDGGHAVQMALSRLLAKNLRLPTLLPELDGRPDFYVGNARTIVGASVETNH